MTNQKPFSVGDRVKGSYYGKEYVGTVESARAHTMNLSYKHYIVLDSAITVFSAERDRIIVSIWEPNGDDGNTIEAHLEDDTRDQIKSFKNSFNHDAPYNAEFLGAQPAKAGEDY